MTEERMKQAKLVHDMIRKIDELYPLKLQSCKSEKDLYSFYYCIIHLYEPIGKEQVSRYFRSFLGEDSYLVLRSIRNILAHNIDEVDAIVIGDIYNFMDKDLNYWRKRLTELMQRYAKIDQRLAISESVLTAD